MRFTIINHEARKSLGVGFTEYLIADSIYHLSNSPSFNGEINKTYLADFFGINIRNIREIIKRLINKKILVEGGNRTTQLWWDATSLKTDETSEKKDATSYNIYNNNNNISPIIPLGDEANKKEKEEKHSTDLSFISTDEIIDWRNNLPSKYNLPVFRSKKGMKTYDALNDLWLRERNKYDKETFNRAIANYFADILRRYPRNEYASHRFLLYTWIKQSNALLKFSSL